MEKRRFTDIHSHMLFAVDDGAKDVRQSLSMIRKAYEDGIQAITLTPHYIKDEWDVSPEILQKKKDFLQAELDKEKIPVRLYLGNEIYYVTDIEKDLLEGKALTLNGTRYVLVEFSPDAQSTYIRNGLLQLMNAGYKPIIAHAERYEGIASDRGLAELIRNFGVLIQVNVSSAPSGFFSSKDPLVTFLLKNHLVDFLGTDAHRDEGRRVPEAQKELDYLYHHYDPEYIDRIAFQNAEDLLNIK